MKKWQIPAHFGNQFSIPDDNPMQEKVVNLGRKLFFDTRLSFDNSIACATCHQPKKAFTDGNKVAIGIYGQKGERNTMSLVNLLWNKNFFWDGRSKSLEEQSLHPITDKKEMGMTIEILEKKLQNIPEYVKLFQQTFKDKKISIQNIAKALAQFERTLISSNSKYDKIVRGEIIPTEKEKKAINLFFTHPIAEAGIRGGNCGDCHGSHLTTLQTFHNNGLDTNPTDIGLEKITKKISDRGKMKAPSLRNIAFTAPYMHDGRFKNLEEVLDHYNEHIQNSPYLDALIIEATNEPNGKKLHLTKEEKESIILFLNMLTDSSFIDEKRWKN
jgi:cytochrome c peroxidase